VHQGVVAHTPQQPVRDPRSTAAARCDLETGLGRDVEVEHACGAIEHLVEFGVVVELEVRREAEPVAQRIGQEPGACRGTDQRERRQIERDTRRPGSLAHHDVDPEVLHGEVEHLFG